MSENSLDCKTSESASALTVGASFELDCEGDFSQLDFGKLKVEALNQPEYSVQLLKSEIQASHAKFNLTSYRVMEFKDVQLRISDGKVLYKTSPISWKVQSVLDPNHPEAHQPFGPFGPWKIQWPLWFFVAFVLFVACVIYAAIRAWRKTKKALETRKRISEYRARFNPFDQFQKFLRQKDREVQSERTTEQLKLMMQELQSDSLKYLMMEFEFDTEKKSPKKIVKKLKKLAPKAREAVFQDLNLFLSEFDRSKNKDVNSHDVEMLIEWAGRMSENINRDSLGVKA